MRVATYNVENLFSRVKAMTTDNPAKSKEVLEDVSELQRLIHQPTYSEADKVKMLKLLNKHKALGDNGPIFLQETRKRLVWKGKIIADERGDWVGWIEWRRTAERIEKETNVRIEEGKQELSRITDGKNKVEKELRDEQALVAKKTEERRAAIAQRDKAQQEYDALQRQIAQLGQRGGQTAVAQEATAIAKDGAKTTAERKALVEDRTKARLFFFVMDEWQKSRILALAPQLEQQGLFVTNVLLTKGKREDTTVVRYFRYPDDKAEVEKTEAALKALGLERSRVSYVNDPDSVGSGRKFQIWVKQGDFAQ